MKTMIKANLTALAVVGAIAFPGAYGNTMHIKSFVDEQHKAYHHGGYSPSVVRGTESKIDPPKTRKIKYGKKASSTGQSVPRTFPSHRHYMDWLNSLGWQTIPLHETTNESRLEDSQNLVGNIVPKFSSEVFDLTKKDNLEYIQGIQSRCGSHTHSHNITSAEILACHMYFNPVPGISSVTNMPYALGPITLETNLLHATQSGEYRANTVNGLFSPNAMAVMIQKGCFIFNTENIESTSKSRSYVDSESYSSSFQKESGASVSAKASYGPFAVNAGYSQQVKTTQSQSVNRKVAYGSGAWEASVGTMTNQCLQNPDFFPLIKDLFDPNVVQQWKSIIDNGAASSDFNAVAMGGVFIPTSYHYGVHAGYDITASYVALSSTAASEASDAISAGASAGYGEGTASIQSKVSSAIDKTGASSSIDFSHETETRYVNVVKNFDFTIAAVSEEATEMKKDVNKIGLPTKVTAYTTLAAIVNMYYGYNTALGDSFETGLKNQFAYFKCNSGSYQYFDGFGDEIVSGSGSCSPVACLSAMSVYPFKEDAPNPRSPCLANGGSNPYMVPSICNLNQCSNDGYYDDTVNYCFATSPQDDDQYTTSYCWYPTPNYPAGDWTSGGSRGDSCGSKCTAVCQPINTHC